jgi:hypothetical protein
VEVCERVKLYLGSRGSGNGKTVLWMGDVSFGRDGKKERWENKSMERNGQSLLRLAKPHFEAADHH